MNKCPKPEQPEQEPTSPFPALLIIFGLLSCCLGPTMLALLSFLGSWLSDLPMLQAYRSWLLVPVAATLFLAWRRAYRPLEECGPSGTCASPPKSRVVQKTVLWIASIASFRLLAYPLLAPHF